jgi:hypothetical protein
MVSSTSIRNRRGAERLFSSWDILRGLRCQSSSNTGRLGACPPDYQGGQGKTKPFMREARTVLYVLERL